MSNAQPVSDDPAPKPRISSGEWLGLALLAILAIYFVSISWRKWPDALVDFGRELYLPWRITNGALLYRDVDDEYGPLSPYFNAALFSTFGPGMMVLVAANLLIFAGIVSSIYLLARRAWGIGGAVAGSAIFIAVFGFSQFVGVGNYNFATPYSHQATHGLFVCVVLAIVLLRWIENATLWRALLCGFLAGLSAVLKPEAMLASGALAVAAIAIRWRQFGRPQISHIGIFLGGSILPTLGFILYFACRAPFSDAFVYACRAWLMVSSDIKKQLFQKQLVGLDQPLENFTIHARATFMALALIGGIFCASSFIPRSERRGPRAVLSGLLLGGIGWLSMGYISWPTVGTCLLGLVLIYLCFAAVSLWPKNAPDFGPRAARVLFAVLAAAFMARMLLNGRIFHYGFYQAALAGTLIPAVLIGELPFRFEDRSFARFLSITAGWMLVAPAVIILSTSSEKMLELKTLPVSQGSDQFYSYPQQMDPTGAIIGSISDELRRHPEDKSMLVLPEGAMMNYLARKPSTIAPLYFFGAIIDGGREQQIVQELQARPPDLVVLLSRDLREYGIERYGEEVGKGKLLLQWASANYQVIGSVGGNPLDYQQTGAVVLKRKTSK